MKEKITVVVPVYQVEKYVGECVESICNQTYTNLEIILVDDGSKDKSGEICDEYAKKDSRIKVIHKANGGLSDARNAGIDIATGKYICFIDSDDMISPYYISSLYELIKENKADVAVCNYQEVNNILEVKKDINQEVKVYTADEALKQFYETNTRDSNDCCVE